MRSLQELIEAAKAQNWPFVDEHLQNACAAEEVRQWPWLADTGLDGKNGDLRELAAGILEKTDEEITGSRRQLVEHLIANDANHYARFRLAFALAGRGDRSNLVRTTLEKALDDDAVGGIAGDYLSKW